MRQQIFLDYLSKLNLITGVLKNRATSLAAANQRGGRMRKTPPTSAGCEDEMGLPTKDCAWPLETEKCKKMDFPQSIQGGTQPH